LIAKGIRYLGETIQPDDVVIPIGLDGAIIYHLLVEHYKKYNLVYDLSLTVQPLFWHENQFDSW